VLDRDTLKQLEADKLWQSALVEISRTYSEFISGTSKCNVILLITERNYFTEFYEYLLKPHFEEKFHEEIHYGSVINGAGLRRYANEIKEKIVFLTEGLNWLADRYARKHRIKAVKDLLQASSQYGKFLILCGYTHNLSRFREYLSLAYASKQLPEVRVVNLKPLP